MSYNPLGRLPILIKSGIKIFMAIGVAKMSPFFRLCISEINDRRIPFMWRSQDDIWVLIHVLIGGIADWCHID